MHFLILTTNLFVWGLGFFVGHLWKGVPRYLLMIADVSTMYFERVEGPIEREDLCEGCKIVKSNAVAPKI